MSEHEPTQPGGPDDGLQPEQREADGRDVPRLYVASLSDYNNGILHGRWLDAAVEPDELWAGVREMLAESPTAKRFGEPAEEWAIHDYDNFGRLSVHEVESVDWITAVARGIVEHGPAFAVWADVVEDGPGGLEGFEDGYLGEWESVEAYAESYFDDIGIEQELDRFVPESLRPYVKLDAEALAHDMELSGDVHAVGTPEGKVWLFRA